MDAKIEKGVALVLVGPQGCGKTTLARKLAAAAGSYCELDAKELESNRQFSQMLEQELVTCIVDGLPQDEGVLQWLEAIITNGETVVNRKHQEPSTRRSPNFIFCTNDPEPRLEERRFHIVRMPSRE